jgi:hypothetical protein
MIKKNYEINKKISPKPPPKFRANNNQPHKNNEKAVSQLQYSNGTLSQQQLFSQPQTTNISQVSFWIPNCSL